MVCVKHGLPLKQHPVFDLRRCDRGCEVTSAQAASWRYEGRLWAKDERG